MAEWGLRVLPEHKASPETPALKVPAPSVLPAQLVLWVLPEHKASPETRALKVRLWLVPRGPLGPSDPSARKA